MTRQRVGSSAEVAPPPLREGPTISACLIVKNEERHLARCLTSLRPIANQVILVDTGSVDATVDIAREFGATVYHFDWCNDFAAARNESLKHATCDWALWIDADEELIEDTPGALRKLCAAAPAGCSGLWTQVHNLADASGTLGNVAEQWRIFRNHIGAHFQGRIHEQLRLRESRHISLMVQDSVRIRHWGYIRDPELLKRKGARNRPLLEQAMRDLPTDPYNPYCLGKQLIGQLEFQEALPYLDEALKRWKALGAPTYAYLGNLITCAMLAHNALGQSEQALDLEQLIPSAFVSADSLYNTAIACRNVGRTQDAIDRLERAWQDPSVRLTFENDPACATWKPLIALAEIYGDLDRNAEAYSCAVRAQEYAPEQPNILFALAFLAARLQKFDQCLSWIDKLLAGDSDDGFKAQGRRLLLNLGQAAQDPGLIVRATDGEVAGLAAADAALVRAPALEDTGDVQGAYDTLDRALGAAPESFPVRQALAALLDRQGYSAQALTILAGGLDQPQAPPEFYEQLAALLTRQQRFAEAADALELAQRIRGAGSHEVALSGRSG